MVPRTIMVHPSSPAPTRLLSIFLLVAVHVGTSHAQQSAAGQDTLLGIVGRDFVVMGADSSSSGGGGIALTSSNMDKIGVIHDGTGVVRGEGGGGDLDGESWEQQAIAVGFAGDAADADRLMGTLRTHVQVREYEAGIGNDVMCVFDGRLGASKSAARLPLRAHSPAGLDAESVAHFSRHEIASRMRSRQPLNLCLLVGGLVHCNDAGPVRQAAVADRVQKQVSLASETYKSRGRDGSSSESDPAETDNNEPESGRDGKNSTSNPFLAPKLFWLDQYGSLQNMRYAAHGFASNFAYSVLDQRYRNDLSREEAIDLIRECFEQLRQRYVINSPRPPRIKCIDACGVTEITVDTMSGR